MLVMKIKKMHLSQLNLRNFMRIQELKTIKNNSLTFLELYIMNLKKSNLAPEYFVQVPPRTILVMTR